MKKFLNFATVSSLAISNFAAINSISSTAMMDENVDNCIIVPNNETTSENSENTNEGCTRSFFRHIFCCCCKKRSKDIKKPAIDIKTEEDDEKKDTEILLKNFLKFLNESPDCKDAEKKLFLTVEKEYENTYKKFFGEFLKPKLTEISKKLPSINEYFEEKKNDLQKNEISSFSNSIFETYYG